ncbi:MAG: DUF4855 domain-containing protein [Bacteroidales bacterium]|nr:DUF4855 domain-containing protein [Bacteroidales bacterium]
MRRIALIAAAAMLVLHVSCEKKPVNNPEDWSKYYQNTDPDNNTTDPGAGQVPEDKDYPDRTAPEGASDMVLIYGGSTHRSPVNWPESYLKDYVRYTDKSGRDHWFFDGFLLLEFMMTQYNKTLITGYQENGVYLHSATREVWEALIDYYFQEGSGVDALDAAVKSCAQTMGTPPSKRKVVIGIPEPIMMEDSHGNTGGSDYWGSIDGERMDFSVTADRVKAVKWYIDRIRERFLAKDYEYVELTGFYWVAEKATQTRDMIRSVADYLHTMNYAFSWIPYFNADGFADWKQFGFDFGYLQPNYFFYNNTFDRLAVACDMANRANMGMEVEFDGNAVSANGYKLGYKLHDYLSEFKKYGIWEKRRVVYYQGSWALRWLNNSPSEADVDLYHELGEWVTSRPIREENQ